MVASWIEMQLHRSFITLKRCNRKEKKKKKKKTETETETKKPPSDLVRDNRIKMCFKIRIDCSRISLATKIMQH